MEKNKITAVIRTKNSGKTIQLCLEKLLEQTVKVEGIIIVDSGSTDNTLEIVGQVDCEVLHYPKEEAFNYSKALNIGIAQAKTDYILNLSSHVLLENPNSLAFLLEHKPGQNSLCTVCMQTRGKHIKQATNWEDMEKVEHNLDNFRGYAMSNACALFLKKYWEEHPFDEKLPAAEEQEWVLYFMKKYNHHSIIIYNPYVDYKNPYTNTYKKARDMYTVAKYIYPPFSTLKHITWLLTLGTLRVLRRRDIKSVIINFRFAFMLLKDKLGVKFDVPSVYHEKLK